MNANPALGGGNNLDVLPNEVLEAEAVLETDKKFSENGNGNRLLTVGELDHMYR